MFARSRSRRIGLLVGLTAALIAGSAGAADTGNGSKNFRAPTSVPNYFSNEAGPMLGPAVETQRGPLYMSQTYGTPQATEGTPVAAPQARQHIAMAQPRGKLVRGRRGARIYAHHVIVQGRPVARVAAHGSGRAHTTYAARREAAHTARRAATHAVSKSTRVSSARHHARG